MSSPITNVSENATTLLFCPACAVARPPRRNTAIGAHRTICPICNSFAQRMMKATRQRMKAALTDEQYRRLWQECAVDHYPAVIARWTVSILDRSSPSRRRRRTRGCGRSGMRC